MNSRNCPQYSIVIPVYNAEKTLTECLQSLMRQEFNDFEVFLIDDGSTDRSLEICKEFSRKDKRFKTIHQQNKGVSSARNLGIKQCIGEYICFLDSDDVVYKNWLSNFYKGKNTDVCVQGCKNVFKNSISVDRFSITSYYDSNNIMMGINEVIQNRLFNAPWSKCYKNKIIKDYHLEFKYGVHLYEDLIFSLQYFQHIESLSLIDAVGYEYRIINSNLTNRFNPPSDYLNWMNIVFDESMKLFTSKNEIGYKLIITSQFSLAIYYLMSFFTYVDIKERFRFYMFFRHISKYILFERLPKRKRIVSLFCIPPFIYDIIIFSLSMWHRIKLFHQKRCSHIKKKLKNYYQKYSNLQWHIGFVTTPLDKIINGEEKLSVCLMSHSIPSVWFADPFILDVDDNIINLLVEEFDESEKKGVISKLIIDKKNYSLIRRKRVLELDTHLSYPAIIRKENLLYIYPENHDSGKLKMYIYDDIEECCHYISDLCDTPLTDATITTLFGKEQLYSTHIPIHNKNLLKLYEREDVTQKFQEKQTFSFNENIARMAGDFFEYQGKIYRPAQECNKMYGHALSLQEVNVQDGELYFKEVVRITSPIKRYNVGIHTFNMYKDIIVVDLKGFEYPFGKLLYKLRHL